MQSTSSPSQVNFLVFTSVWTSALAVPYLALSPRFLPMAAHKFGILAAEAATMIFWFAAFLAAAVFLSGLDFCRGVVCGAARGAVVFGAFEWYAAWAGLFSFFLFLLRGPVGWGPTRSREFVDECSHRVLFAATTTMAVIHVLRTRSDAYGRQKGMQYHERV